MKTKMERQILGRTLDVQYSKSAVKKQLQLQQAVYLEMELHFGCMVKKSIIEKESVNTKSAVQLNDVMFLSFRPFMTNVCAPCSVNIHEDESIEIIDIERPERFVPDWVLIDYQDGQWVGDFGYTRRNGMHVSNNTAANPNL